MIAPREAQLQEIIETQRNALQSIIAERDAYKEKYQYLLSALSNKALPEQARKAQIALKLDADYNPPDADGWYTPYLDSLGNYVGNTASTLSRGVQLLADCTDAIEVRKVPMVDQPAKSVLQVRHIIPLATLSRIVPTKEVARHGGDHRVTCPACQSKDIIETKKQICRSCGTVVKDFEDTAVNKLSGEPIAVNKFVAPAIEDDLQDASGEISEIEQETEQENTGDVVPLASCKLNYVRTQSSLVAPCDENKKQDASGRATAFEELKALPIWACWRYEANEKGKPTKVPYNAETLVKAKSNDPTTWRPYDQAQAMYERSQSYAQPFTGIGFMCNGDYTVIDQDHCIDALGNISEQARARVASINSYTEISYSRTGLHTITRGSITKGVKRAIEMYCKGRFMVFTGNHLPGTPGTIEDRQPVLDALYAELIPPVKETRPIEKCVSATLPLLSSEQVLLKARNGANGERFKALYDDGNISGYPSQSEADLALCEEIGYRSDKDAEIVDRLFRQSRLYRDKWDRSVGGGETYGERTIRLALVRKQVAS